MAGFEGGFYEAMTALVEQQEREYQLDRCDAARDAVEKARSDAEVARRIYHRIVGAAQQVAAQEMRAAGIGYIGDAVAAGVYGSLQL